MTHENYLVQCVALTSLYPFAPGFRYLSILPTNHAIDFMVGFFGPFICGATVVHLRTLRPEFVREAFTKYKITYVSLVPLVLKNLQKGLQARFDELPSGKRRVFHALVAINKAFTKTHPRLGLSRLLLKQVHDNFGGELRAIIVGGAFTEPQTLQFFYDLGIPVANGYGLTEAGTAITVNDLHPFRADSVGKPLPGMEVRIVDPDPDGIGQVTVRSKTVMSGYLNEPELTAETIVDGWLMTGDIGRLDADGFLYITGRKKELIVTSSGKNIAPVYLESLLTQDPLILQAMVIGDGRSYLSALIVPNTDVLQFELSQRGLGGLPASEEIVHPEILAVFQSRIDQRLAGVSHHEQIRKFTLLARPFSIEAGELTPKLSLRRQTIAEHYRDEIEAMYQKADDSDCLSADSQ